MNSFIDLIKDLEENVDNLLITNLEYLKPIRSMLGTRLNSLAEVESKIEYPIFSDYKYDGLRLQIHKTKDKIKMFSRNLEDLTNQFPEILDFLNLNFKEESFILDCECVAFDYKKKEFFDFQILSKRILKKDIDITNSVTISVKVFDILKKEDETLIEIEYKKRREILENLFLNKELIQNSFL